MSAAHAEELQRIRSALKSLYESRIGLRDVERELDLPSEIREQVSKIADQICVIADSLEKRIDTIHRSLEMGVP